MGDYYQWKTGVVLEGLALGSKKTVHVQVIEITP